MKILHIASFVGNIGDILSNLGAQRFLEQHYGDSLSLTRVEIRQFHKNVPHEIRLSLNQVLRDAADKFDRVIIGGGGFLDYWVPDSSSGATIELSPDTLKLLGNRLIISSVGAYPHRTVPEQNLKLFPSFLENLQTSGAQLMFRNDGSIKDLTRVFSSTLTSNLFEAGDHCYLLHNRLKLETFRKNSTKPYIVVNIGPDQLEMHSGYRGKIDQIKFYQNLAGGLLNIANELDVDILFIPHLISDFTGISRICALFPDLFLRERVRVLNYAGTDSIIDPVLEAYAEAMLCVCGRLHANILPLVLDRPTVSLGILDRVSEISRQHSMSVLVNRVDGNFADELSSAATTALAMNPDGSSARIRVSIEEFLQEALGSSKV